MRIQVVTDSACDIPDEIIESYGIRVIPNYINIGDKSYRDGVDMTRQQFYDGLGEFPSHPKTAAVGPEMFTKVYQEASKNGYDQVLSIHVAGKLSTTFNSALQAATESKFPVTVHDSEQLSLGAGLQVIAACKAATEGLSIKEIERMITDLGNRTHVYAILDTLKFLYRSGRVNLATRGIGSLLRIKPLMTVYKGVPIFERVRTQGKAIERMFQHIQKLGPLEHMSIVHTQASDAAKKLYQMAQSLIPENNQPYIQTVTPAIGAHVGSNAIGLVCVTS